jgi:glycosyltransferase involved in cell wall biosynthesis
MVKRPIIGLLFSVTEKWMGGTYYFQNIIAALNTLEDNKKPEIVIYSENKKSFKLALETGYPYLKYECSHFQYSFAERIINKAGRSLTGKTIVHKGLSPETMPLLFGYYEQLVWHKCEHKVYWMADFQEFYYPEFVGEEATAQRKLLHKQIIDEKTVLVFSSQDGLDDFTTFYPYHNSKLFIVRFAVTHPDFSDLDINILREKYNLKGLYFFTPNQFWPHKNHITLLKAAKNVKEKGLDIKLVFSGRYNQEDKHVKMLQQYILDNDLSDNIIFLGFIDRKEQLCLMKNSLAIVQPSLFEGWNTGVEDAKALGKFLILSDLEVHREQAQDYCCDFFDAENDEELSECLINSLRNPPIDSDYQYHNNIKRFAEDFITAMSYHKTAMAAIRA